MNCNNEVVAITKIVNGGYGLARAADGKTVFVRFTLPGETVAIKISDEKKRIAFGHVLDVLKPGSGRIEPPCPYYGRCGGCNLQHADYHRQCQIKQAVLFELFSRSPQQSLKDSADLIKPIIGSDAPFGYRQRIRLKIDEYGRPGFSHFRSHKIVGVSRCLLAVEPINRCLADLPVSKDFDKLAAIAEELEILYNPLSRRVSLLLNLSRPPRPSDRSRARSLCAALDILERVFLKGHFTMEGPYCRDEHDEDHIGRDFGFVLDGNQPPLKPLQFSWEIGGFSQVNLKQNKVLIELVTRLSRARPEDRILDLYCGMGNFSLDLARLAREVRGFEGQGSAIRSARANARFNNLSGCRFSKSDVAAACRALRTDRECFDIVICDPPRRGMSDLIDMLAGLTRKRLVYISCDPATLCRDLGKLVNDGFKIRTVQPVDMFPQTHHIETVVVLEKSAP